MSELSRRILQRRLELGLSQEELAQRMGYRSKSSITKLEKGVNDIPQAKLEELAAALETTPAYLLGLDAKKPVILCGDLNVAHTEIDIKNAKTNRMSAGFTDQERAKMTELLAAGFTDTFRAVHPDEVKYSWWSYRFHAREKNAGWRIDYFIVSNRIADKVTAAEIHNEVFGSDHCPVELVIDL